MANRSTPLWRHLLPWVVSAAALFYVFGFSIDWAKVESASGNANLPLFIGITIVDKLAFFLVFAFVQAHSIRKFVEPVSTRSILAVKGAAELIRTFSNLLSDGAFLYGVSRLVQSGFAAIIAVILIPFGCHFFILLLQATMVFPFLEGGPRANLDVTIALTAGWTAVGVFLIGGRLGYLERASQRIGFGGGSSIVLRLAPVLLWFAGFAAFDVLVQGLASRAFGVEIDWLALTARIPMMYVALSIPSFGNFGTRELAWSTLFADYGSREELVAFALWTNTIFAVMHAVVGSLFIGRALSLLRALRQAKREGEGMPSPILREAIDRND